MNDNLSLSGDGGVTKSMTFEQKRRAAFEEEMKRRNYPIIQASNGLYCGITAYHWQTWQAALEWQNKGERG